MGLLTSTVLKETRRIEFMIDKYEQIRATLPKGTICRKRLGNKDYYYLKYRDGDRVVSDYIHREDLAHEEPELRMGSGGHAQGNDRGGQQGKDPFHRLQVRVDLVHEHALGHGAHGAVHHLAPQRCPAQAYFSAFFSGLRKGSSWFGKRVLS